MDVYGLIAVISLCLACFMAGYTFGKNAKK